MSISLHSYTLQGLNALPVHIEVEVSPGMPLFSIIGMAGTSVQEAKDRVRSALVSSGFRFPLTRKIVNLAPAELHKSGSHFDLPIALGFLKALGEIEELSRDVWAIGELGLSGELRPVKGLLPALLFARKNGVKRVLLPRENLREASLVEGLSLLGFSHEKEVVSYLKKGFLPEEFVETALGESPNGGSDFESIAGHSAAKRALAIAASGGHHLLLSGPPGSGKTLLAQSFAGLLPPLSAAEKLEVLAVHSVAGQSHISSQIARPFRSIHPRSTPFTVFGGGASLSPGELSLAHRGVLMMDEFPEFSRDILEGLRGPLEGQSLLLRYGKSSCRYPCEFQLVATRNPCPCGYASDPEKACRCTAAEKERYQKKISGPILDRIDLAVEVPRLAYDDLKVPSKNEGKSWKERVFAARERQSFRQAKTGVMLNQQLSSLWFQTEKLDLKTEDFLRQATRHHHLSGRGLHKVLKVARSIADFEGRDQIECVHVAEALQYRI